jgi:hypothetical protein
VTSWPQIVVDPDGRQVVFDGATHLHLARRKRQALLEQVDAIMEAVRAPDFRESDPIPGRERFYRADFNDRGAWLLVVVDFTDSPGWIVTIFLTHRDPQARQR